MAAEHRMVHVPPPPPAPKQFAMVVHGKRASRLHWSSCCVIGGDTHYCLYMFSHGPMRAMMMHVIHVIACLDSWHCSGDPLS